MCVNSGNSTRANMWNFCSNTAVADVVLATQTPLATTSTSAISEVGMPAYFIDATDGSTSHWVEDGVVAGTRSVGPVDTFKLVLNGKDRFKEQSGKYFNQVQPFNHHSGSPYPGIYSYSFALKPEEHQPTGTCNFSRIDNAQVAITLKNLAGTSLATPSLDMFAVNYNVLRIQSGMGGLAFSN